MDTPFIKKKRPTPIQILASDELKLKFDEAFQFSGAHSKAQFIELLIDFYFKNEGNEVPKLPEVPKHDIVIRLSEDQRNILNKLYAQNEGISVEILRDLIKLSMEWKEISRPGLFNDGKYQRLYSLFDISEDEFNAAFGQFLSEN